MTPIASTHMQLRQTICSPVRALALRHARLNERYVHMCRRHGDEYSSLRQRQIGLHAVGNGCHINFSVFITDPQWVSIGINFVMSDCSVLGHDASEHMLSKARGLPLDAVGQYAHQLELDRHARRNDWAESGVSAGEVVTKDLPPGAVVGGVSAKQIGTVDELVGKMRERTLTLPCVELIEQRGATTVAPRFDQAPGTGCRQRLLSERPEMTRVMDRSAAEGIDRV